MPITKREGKRGVAYRVTVDFPPDPITGKRRQRTEKFRTRKEAESREREWMTEIERGTAVDGTKMTMGEYLTYWLNTSVRHRVRNTTLNSYEQLIRVHIVPALGSVQIQKLTPAQVQAFYQTKVTEPRLRYKGQEDGLPAVPAHRALSAHCPARGASTGHEVGHRASERLRRHRSATGPTTANQDMDRR
jgi:hypothetical protein